ncbi:efflux RND transporter periplasmic adaptor subunit [Hydrogenobaculum acidophilum]
MKSKTIGILIGIGIIVIAIYAFIKRKEYVDEEKSAKAYPLVLKQAYAKEGSIREGQIFLGKFEPKNEATIASRLSAYILYIAKEGTKVKKGDILVKLDDKDIISNINATENNEKALAFQKKSLEENLKSLKVSYENQAKIFNRDKILYENKAISEEAYEKSQDAYERAKSAYKGAIEQINAIQNQMQALNSQASALEDSLNYTTIRAPFDGVVSKRYLKVGNLATPGKPLLDLEGVGDDYEVYVDVPQNILSHIKVGDEEKIMLNGKSQKAIVETIIPKAQNNMISIKLLTKGNNIEASPDMYIKTKIYTGACKGTLIPVNAVNHTYNGYYAMEVLNGVVHWVKFNPMARNEEYFCTKDMAPNTILGLANRSEMLSIQDGRKVKLVK